MIRNKETRAVVTSETNVVPAKTIVAVDRPETVAGTTYKVSTSYGNLYITINNDVNGRPFEIFANIGKAGGFFCC